MPLSAQSQTARAPCLFPMAALKDNASRLVADRDVDVQTLESILEDFMKSRNNRDLKSLLKDFLLFRVS